MNSIRFVLLISLSSLFHCQFNQPDDCRIVKQKLVCSRVTPNCPKEGCEKFKEINYDSNLNRLLANSFSNYEIKDELTINLNNLKRIEHDAFSGLLVHSNAHLIINMISNQTTDDQIKTNLIFESNALKNLILTSGSKLTIRVRNYDFVEFKSNSILSQLNQHDQSQVSILVELSNHVVFRSSLTGSKQSLESANSHLSFKINISKCNDVIFEKDSFSNQIQSQFSLFQIIANDFNYCRLGRLSFSQIKQSESSYYELNLNGKRLILSEEAFSSIEQSPHSKFIINFNISESSVCLKSKTFSDIMQSLNSTVRVSFHLREENDFIVKKEAILNLKQNMTSNFQIYVLRPADVQLEGQSVSNLVQDQFSFFEIWVSKAKANFLIEQNAFFKVKQGKGANVHLGFTSSLNGFFYQSPNSFSQLLSESNSQVTYDFTPGTNFSLKFPLRPIPRIMPLSVNSNMTIEEVIYKMFPNLGRQSRPDLINLKEYKLEANDFCSIAEIPFDVLVKLRPDTDCSCSVYYLYRLIRRIRNDTDKWVLNTPECYQKKIESLNKPVDEVNLEDGLNEKSDLKTLEKMCKFKEMVNNCKLSMSNNIPVEKKNNLYLKDCDGSFDFYESDQYSSLDETYVYEDDGEVYNDETPDSIFDNYSYDDKDEDKIESEEEEDYDGYNQVNDKETKPNKDQKEKQITPNEQDIYLKKLKMNSKISTMQTVFIVILTMILFAILIAVLIVFRLNKREHSVPTNDDSDDDDDNENENDNDDLVVQARKTKGSIFKPIQNKINKQKKKLGYSMFNKQSNSALSNLISDENDYSNRSIVVECDRKNSITSSVASDDYMNNVNETKQNEKESPKRIYQHKNENKKGEILIDAKIKANYDIYN